MAAITITAANVRPLENVDLPMREMGEAVDQGEALYRDTSTGKYYLTDATVAAKQKVEAIAMGKAAADGDFIPICTKVGARINIGATTVKGTTYVAGVNSTAGSHSPQADATTGDAVLPSFIAEDTAGNVSLILHTPSTAIEL